MRKKVLWIAHEANKSGANLCLKEFMQITAANGFEQLLILPHKGNMELVANELRIPVKIIHYYSWVTDCDTGFLKSLSLRKILRNIVAVLQLSFIIVQNRFSFIFTNTSVISVGAWASIFTATKHYWYVHEMGEEDFGFKLPWGKLSYSFMKLTSKKVITNSNHLAEKYRKKLAGFQIDVIRYAVFVNGFIKATTWIKEQRIRLLLLGQIAETKGHFLALNAIALLKKYGYNVEVSFVGTCEMPEFMQKITKTIDLLGIKDIVHITKYTDQPTQVIASHNILLMCSKCEAFGRVTIEAMKIGVPVVGSNTCGTKEIIEHKKTGYLFEQGNVEDLVAAIRLVIDNDNLRLKVVREANVRSESLTNTSHFLSFLNHQ